VVTHPTPAVVASPAGAGLKVLFVGGTGVISAAAAERAVAVGHQLTMLNRGNTVLRAIPQGVELLHADIRDTDSVRTALGDRRFDVVADFTITSDEYLPWNTIYQLFAEAAGAPPPRLVHIASETIAAAAPQLGPSLLGDRSHSVIFDNSKVKALVPEFVCTTPYTTGVRDIIDWYDANPDQQIIDHDLDATFDHLIAAYHPLTLSPHDRAASRAPTQSIWST
jgi:nucleoside-diphosphate-sugar epimerase